VDKAAQKIAVYYAPQFLLLPSVRSQYDTTTLSDAAVDMTADEVMANTPDIRIFNKLLFEIDCTAKRFKLLEVTLYDESGNPKYRPTRPNAEYQFVAPDTNGEWLSMLVCPSK